MCKKTSTTISSKICSSTFRTTCLHLLIFRKGCLLQFSQFSISAFCPFSMLALLSLLAGLLSCSYILVSSFFICGFLVLIVGFSSTPYLQKNSKFLFPRASVFIVSIVLNILQSYLYHSYNSKL